MLYLGKHDLSKFKTPEEREEFIMANPPPTEEDFYRLYDKRLYGADGKQYDVTAKVYFSGTPVLIRVPNHAEDTVWRYPDVKTEYQGLPDDFEEVDHATFYAAKMKNLAAAEAKKARVRGS